MAIVGRILTFHDVQFIFSFFWFEKQYANGMMYTIRMAALNAQTLRMCHLTLVVLDKFGNGYQLRNSAIAPLRCTFKFSDAP